MMIGALFRVCVFAVVALCSVPSASALNKPEIEREALGALSRLYSRNSMAAALGRHCVAVVVFPGAHMLGFGLAVQSGSGVLFFRGVPAAYFNLTGASLGLELGVQKFDYTVFFEDYAALDRLYEGGGFDFGIAPAFVLGDALFSGRYSSFSMRDGVYPFTSNQQGFLISLGLGKLKLTEFIPSD